MANTTNYTGLWIPINILSDEKLSDKEKLILAIIIFHSKNSECTTSNQSFGDIFNLSTNRVSKIISSLKDKNYIKVNFLYKDNRKEIAKRTLIPIGNNNNNPIVKDDNKYCQNQQQAIGENDKVNKSIYKNNNIYNNFGTNNNRSKPTWQKGTSREYTDEFFKELEDKMQKEALSRIS